MIHVCNPSGRGYSPSYRPNPKYVRMYNVDYCKVLYKLRQKLRQIEFKVMEIQMYSSADIRLYIDSDYCTLINFTNNRVLFHYPISDSLALLQHQLNEVCEFHYCDRYPEQIKTMSQYNYYLTLKQKYYDTKN